MNTHVLAEPKSATKSDTSQARGNFLQRRRACSDTPNPTGERTECREKGRFHLQAKLKTNDAGDIYEQEADRIADRVVAAPMHSSVRGVAVGIRQLCGQTNGQIGSAPRSVDAALASPGMPLDPGSRHDMEQRFGYDFSKVRVHSGSIAEQSAQDVNANAYTVGQNIVFGAGRFARETPQGRRLLAHELTHVVQQGYASVVDSRAVKAAPGRMTPAIQRDTPSKDNIPHVSITKSYDPQNASRDEVVQALTDYLNKEWAVQGKRRLQVTARVRTAIETLFQENPTGSATFSFSNLPDSPAAVAAKVGAALPDTIPRRYMMHLYKEPEKAGGSTSTLGKVKGAVKEKIGELGKPPPVTGEANRPVEAPSNQPTMGESPGQHNVKTPELPFGGGAPPSPKPDVSQGPVASADKAVNNVVQALDKDALVPAAAKGTDLAGNFADAREFARSVANQLKEAQARKQSSVSVVIPQGYKSAADLREIYNRMDAIVRQIAQAVPDGVKDVDEVIISPAQAPAYRRVVKLHSGD
ncbi:MAG TPA: DUF4157 domain-containing protein [Chthoniobacterales bacterium]|nr:DUF4157 domain-containing protein [Chthoniobacterales bacterium]